MITATATGANGERIILLGLARENIERMTAGRPIRVSAESHPGFPADIQILICFGETVRELVVQLKPLIGEDTKVVAVPKDAGHPRVS